jgi:ribosomal protein L37AE/L43A
MTDNPQMVHVCPNCSSDDLIFVERVKSVTIYRCNSCSRIIAIPAPPPS